MRQDYDRNRTHPRSPVQPDRDPAPYLLAAVAAAFVIWIIQQNVRFDWATHQAAPPAQTPRGTLVGIFDGEVDYPEDARRKGEEGTVRTELAVDRHGRVSKCKIVESSRSRSLDDATCRILRERAQFRPARDANGKPVRSTVVTPPITWRLEG